MTTWPTNLRWRPTRPVRWPGWAASQAIRPRRRGTRNSPWPCGATTSASRRNSPSTTCSPILVPRRPDRVHQQVEHALQLLLPAGQRGRGEHADDGGDDVVRADVVAQCAGGDPGVEDRLYRGSELVAGLGYGHGSVREHGPQRVRHLP